MKIHLLLILSPPFCLICDRSKQHHIPRIFSIRANDLFSWVILLELWPQRACWCDYIFLTVNNLSGCDGLIHIGIDFNLTNPGLQLSNPMRHVRDCLIGWVSVWILLCLFVLLSDLFYFSLRTLQSSRVSQMRSISILQWKAVQMKLWQQVVV